MSEKVRTQHLERKAILYVRQSSQYQVIHNLESQKLQYAMEARLGLRIPITIDHLAPQAVSCGTSLPKTQLNQPALPCKDLHRQLAAIFCCHRALQRFEY